MASKVLTHALAPNYTHQRLEKRVLDIPLFRLLSLQLPSACLSLCLPFNRATLPSASPLSGKQMQREDKHVSMARSMEDSDVLIRYKGTTTMDETAGSSPPPKGKTGAPKHTSNDLEGVRVAPDSTSQGRSLQEAAMLAPQAIVVGGLQAQEAPPNQVSPVWTSRKFPIVPGYHLPSNIEYGDPTEDDERFTFTIAGDVPMNVPPPGAAPRSRRRRRRRGNTPRVVGATNVEHTQPAPAKSPELPLSPGFAESSRPGGVPGATNDNRKRRRRRRRKRNVGAIGSGDDVGSERGDDVSCQPAQDN